jgi:hypothetical protein
MRAIGQTLCCAYISTGEGTGRKTLRDEPRKDKIEGEGWGQGTSGVEPARVALPALQFDFGAEQLEECFECFIAFRCMGQHVEVSDERERKKQTSWCGRSAVLLEKSSFSVIWFSLAKITPNLCAATSICSSSLRSAAWHSSPLIVARLA